MIYIGDGVLFVTRLILLLACLCVVTVPSLAQDELPIPTLIPPTLVPVTTGVDEVLYGDAAIAQIIQSNKVRIGILWNEPPFSSFNVKGEVDGLSVGLGKALASAWGVEAEFIQVTRQNDLDHCTLSRKHFFTLCLDFVVAGNDNFNPKIRQLENADYIGEDALAPKVKVPSTCFIDQGISLIRVFRTAADIANEDLIESHREQVEPKIRADFAKIWNVS